MNALEALIVAEIELQGPISFSRYMELALYHPELGFYADGGAGRRRDFITSPEVGPLYGAVVARAIDGWWDEFGQPDHFTVVEAGAGPGMLARTVLRAELRCRGALDYVSVETSAVQRERHPEGVTARDTMPEAVQAGVIFANELLDNLPFDVVRFDPVKGWQEVRIGVAMGRLEETFVATDAPALVDAANAPVDELRIPRQRQAADWLDAALTSLGSGRVVVVDYAVPGYPAEAGREWLRTYSEHGRAGDPLAAPGTKDITADVDLAGLWRVAAPALVDSQAIWLRRHGIDELVDAGRSYWAEHASSPDLRAIEMQSRATEADALLDPAGLGAFTVAEWVVPGPDGGIETNVTR